MKDMNGLYRRFIRKVCDPIMEELEQHKQKSHKLEAENKRLEERILNLERRIDEMKKENPATKIADLGTGISNLGTRTANLEDNIRQNNTRLNALERSMDENRLVRVEENTRKNNDRLNVLERSMNGTRLEKVEDNVRQNNLRLNELEKANSKLEMNLIKVKSSVATAQGTAAPAGVSTAPGNETPVAAPKEQGASAYSKIDYFDFENHFRGPCQNVKERQKMYLPYFENCQSVLDIGCGRGEFLELLKENDITAKGVDIYNEYAEYCQMKDLDVVCGDGIDYLRNCEQLDGIMAAQVVEHLDIDQIVTLCENAYERLTEGGVLVLETPNPKALSIYVNEFYMDPSHVKPVHPETLKYLAQKAGFKDVEIVYTEGSKVPKSIPELKVNAEGNLQEFNSGMQAVSELLYGSRDYAIIARK